MSQYTRGVTAGNMPPSVPLQFDTDAGSAVPAANILSVLGAGGASTSGAGSTITITSVMGAAPFTDEAGPAFTAAVNNGYFCTGALTATLPAAPTQGQFVIIETTTAANVILQASGAQVIRMGNTASSAGGTATSAAEGNSVYLIYRSANTSWYSISTEGTWILA